MPFTGMTAVDQEGATIALPYLGICDVLRSSATGAPINVHTKLTDVTLVKQISMSACRTDSVCRAWKEFTGEVFDHFVWTRVNS